MTSKVLFRPSPDGSRTADVEQRGTGCANRRTGCLIPDIRRSPDGAEGVTPHQRTFATVISRYDDASRLSQSRDRMAKHPIWGMGFRPATGDPRGWFSRVILWWN